MSRLIVLLMVATLLACQQEQEPTWPTRPPSLDNRLVQSLAAFGRDHAGPGAVDCGVAWERWNENSIYACAEDSFRSGHPFSCVFRRWPQQPRSLQIFTGQGNLSGSPVVAEALFSRGDSLLRSATIAYGGAIESGLLFDKSRDRPSRVGGFVHAPVFIDSAAQTAMAKPEIIKGIILIECVINRLGMVETTNILKPLPGNATMLADAMVRSARFRPGTVFGYPTSVYFNVTIHDDHGKLSIR